MKTHTQIKADLVTWLGTLSLPVVSGAIVIEAKRAPDAKLEKGKGTSIQVYMTASEIGRSARGENERLRTVRLLVRHRLVSENSATKVAEEQAWELLHYTLEAKLIRYVAADGESKAESVTTAVILDGQQYYEEGVMAALVDVTIRNYESVSP